MYMYGDVEIDGLCLENSMVETMAVALYISKYHLYYS